MKLKTVILLTLTALLMVSVSALCVEVDKTISVLFVGKADSPRNAEYESLLKEYFTTVSVTSYADFKFEDASDFDVLVLDYKWGYKGIPKSLPDNWSKSTILIGSGDMMVGRMSGCKINWL